MVAAIYDFAAIRQRLNELENPKATVEYLVQVIETDLLTFKEFLAKHQALFDERAIGIELRGLTGGGAPHTPRGGG